MAFIEQFTVHGLAARDVIVHRKLDRHINVFWGLNGTGKTSLLKILHAALRNDVSSLEGVPFQSAEVIFWSADHEARISRTYDLNDDSGPEDVEFEIQLDADGSYSHVPVITEGAGWTTTVLEGNLSPSRADIPFRHAYLPISRMSQVSRRLGFNAGRPRVVDDEFLDVQFAEQVQARWQFYNAEANTRIRLIQQQGLASILAHLFGGGLGSSDYEAARVPGHEAYGLVSGFLRQQGISPRFGQEEFLRRYEGDNELQLVVANIQEVTVEVQEALQPQEEFQSVIRRLYSGGKELVFDTRRTAQGSLGVEANGTPIPLQALSSGEKQLLRLMLEALAAEAGTVMIDEPELSMHVDWQQVLIASMRTVNPDCQLLLATHSPEVMAEVSDDVVFEL